MLNFDGLPRQAVRFEERQGDRVCGQYHVGIRFEPLNMDFSVLDRTATKESFIRKKHWALVFTPLTATFSFSPSSLRVELQRCSRDEMAFVASPIHGNLEAHPIGLWTGCLHEIKDLMTAHPMNSYMSEYSAWYNNCQHWAATMLILLEAHCQGRVDRSFRILDCERHKRVLSIMATTTTTTTIGDATVSALYNKPNLLFKGATATSMLGGVGVAGLLGSAATATVVTTVAVELPAAGIMGFFGATVVEVIPVATAATAGAVGAAVAIPFVAAGVLVGGMILLTEGAIWKEKTKFEDPRRRFSWSGLLQNYSGL